MSSAQLCLLLMLAHIKFTQSQNDKFDVQWDQTLSKDDQGLKCGIEKNKNKAPSSARIINGDLIHDARYPWMAQIVDILFYSNDTANFKLECSGSVISGKAILTAAHCLCRPPLRIDKDDDDPDNKCLEISWKLSDAFRTSPEKIQLRNQNRFHNQVHYAIGSKNSLRSIYDLASDPAVTFNEKIKAFIYKYEPEWWEEGTEEERRKKKWTWKNGDIGLIIDESGLNLKTKNVIPICLPVPNSFENEFNKISFKVTAAGTGNIYDEFVDQKGRKKTSCMTNEGVARKIGPEYSNIQPVFLQCKDYDRDKKDSCTLVKDAFISMPTDNDRKGYSSRWLSTNIDVSFFPTPNPKSGKDVRIKIPGNDECEHLDKKVDLAYKKMSKMKKFVFETEDGLGPTRIVVFDKGETDLAWKELYKKWDKQSSPSVPYCYNLKKIADIGICETDSRLYNFGFCSISCLLEDPSYEDKERGVLWKMEADYYDTEISTEDEFYSKLVPQESRNYLKCIVPHTPSATIGIFTKDANGDLKFEGMEQDENYGKHANLLRYPDIYMNAGHGDSGGPVMREVTNKNGEKRHVLIAVMTNSLGIKEIFSPDLIDEPVETKCMAQATKLSEEVVSWIKKIHEHGYDLVPQIPCDPKLPENPCRIYSEVNVPIPFPPDLQIKRMECTRPILKYWVRREESTDIAGNKIVDFYANADESFTEIPLPDPSGHDRRKYMNEIAWVQCTPGFINEVHYHDMHWYKGCGVTIELVKICLQDPTLNKATKQLMQKQLREDKKWATKNKKSTISTIPLEKYNKWEKFMFNINADKQEQLNVEFCSRLIGFIPENRLLEPSEDDGLRNIFMAAEEVEIVNKLFFKYFDDINAAFKPYAIKDALKKYNKRNIGKYNIVADDKVEDKGVTGKVFFCKAGKKFDKLFK